VRFLSISKKGSIKTVTVLFLTLALLLAALLLPAPAAGPDKAPAPGTAPFEVGERLVYRVEWNPPWYLFLLHAEVGEATLSLAGETQYKGKKALKITFTARSSGTLVRLAGMKIDDAYEFTTDPETFCTFCATKRVRQGKRMRDIDLVYIPEARKLHIKDVDVSTVVPRVVLDKDFEEIPPCVKDLFSALYAFRRTDLQAGSTQHVLVGDDQHVKEIEVRVVKKEPVSTPLATYDAWQINTVSVLGGLFQSGGQFRIWVSADDRKVPVKFEAKVKLGKVTGELREARY